MLWRLAVFVSVLATIVLAAKLSHASPRQMRAENVQVISHPSGCPARQFCACGLARYWGIWKASLNLAANWAREFPRAHGPAVGVAAVRGDRHHVVGIVGGSPGAWQVVDFNSGGHQSHQYTAASFPGYFFVQVRG
jgi:hypothetical protein